MCYITLLLSGVMLDEQCVGLHASRCVLSPSLTHCVTWATEPVDKTVRFWSIRQGRLTLQGTFTPDAEVRSSFYTLLAGLSKFCKSVENHRFSQSWIRISTF